jgi:hypothetical protein
MHGGLLVLLLLGLPTLPAIFLSNPKEPESQSREEQAKKKPPEKEPLQKRDGGKGDTLKIGEGDDVAEKTLSSAPSKAALNEKRDSTPGTRPTNPPIPVEVVFVQPGGKLPTERSDRQPRETAETARAAASSSAPVPVERRDRTAAPDNSGAPDSTAPRTPRNPNTSPATPLDTVGRPPAAAAPRDETKRPPSGAVPLPERPQNRTATPPAPPTPPQPLAGGSGSLVAGEGGEPSGGGAKLARTLVQRSGGKTTGSTGSKDNAVRGLEGGGAGNPDAAAGATARLTPGAVPAVTPIIESGQPGRLGAALAQIARMDSRLAVALRPPGPAQTQPDAHARDAVIHARMETASKRGFPSAQYNLARMLTQGRGAPRDPERAAYWLERAAERGYTPAQLLLGYIQGGGLGGKPDLGKAKFWWNVAATGRRSGRAN